MYVQYILSQLPRYLLNNETIFELQVIFKRTQNNPKGSLNTIRSNAFHIHIHIHVHPNFSYIALPFWSKCAEWHQKIDGWINQAYSRLSTTHGHITDCKLLVCMYENRLVLVRPAACLYSASPLKHHPTGKQWCPNPDHYPDSGPARRSPTLLCWALSRAAEPQILTSFVWRGQGSNHQPAEGTGQVTQCPWSRLVLLAPRLTRALPRQGLDPHLSKSEVNRLADRGAALGVGMKLLANLEELGFLTAHSGAEFGWGRSSDLLVCSTPFYCHVP